MTDLITKISYEENTAARKKLISGLESIQAEQKKLSVAFAKGEVSSADYNKQLSKLGKEAGTLRKALKPIEDDLKAQERAAIDATLANEKLARSFDDIASERRKSAQVSGADFAGDTSSGIAGLRGGLDALGVGGASPALEAFEGVSDLAESLPLLKAQALAAGEAVSQGSGLVSKLATSATAAVPALGAAGGGLVAITAAALPIAAAVAAGAIALRSFTKASEANAKALGQTIDAQQNVSQAVLDGLTTEEAQQRLDELKAIGQAQQQELSNRQAQYDSALSQVNEAGKNLVNTGIPGVEQALDGLFSTIAVQGTRAFASEEQLLVDTINEAKESVGATNAEIRELERVLSSNQLAANDARVTLEQLQEAEQDLTNERIQAQQKVTQVQATVADINQQIIDTTANRLKQQLQKEEESALEQQFALEDEQAEEAEHYANLAQIARDGRNNLAAIQKDIAAIPLQQQAEIEKITAQGRDKLTSIDDAFFADSQKLLSNYRKQQERAEDDFAKKRLEIIQSTADAQDEAVRGNSVIDFLKASESGQKELSKLSENAGEAAKRQTEDLIARQNELESKRQADIDATLEAIEKDKQATIQSFDEKRQALAESLSAEKAAIEERKQAAIASYEAEENREQQQASRAAQRAELQQRFADEAFEDSIAKLEQRKRAELDLLNDVQQQIVNIQQRLDLNVARQTDTRRGTSAPTTFGDLARQRELIPAFPTSPGVGKPIRIQPFADGGIVTEKTLGLLAENGKPEAIIPLDQFDRVAGRGSGQTINLSLSMPVSVGDISTPQQVSAEIENATQKMVIHLGKFFNNALAGAS